MTTARAALKEIARKVAKSLDRDAAVHRPQLTPDRTGRQPTANILD